MSKVQEKQQAHEGGRTAYEAGVLQVALLEHARTLYASLEKQGQEAKKAQCLSEEAQRSMERGKADYEQKHQIWLSKMEFQKETIAKYTSAQSIYLEGISGTLAESLIENQPCPVCGSKEHPCPAVSTGEKVTEAQLDAYHKQMVNASQEVEQAARHRNQAEQIFQQLSMEAGEKLRQMTIQQHSYEEMLRQKIDQIENSHELESQIQNLKQRVQKYEELTERFQKILLEAQAEVKSGEETLKQMENVWESAREEVQKAEKNWEKAREREEFSSDEAFVNCLIEPEEKNRRKEQVICHKAQWSSSVKALKEQEAKLTDKQMPDLSEEKKVCDQREEMHRKISKEWILHTQNVEKMQRDLADFSRRKQIYDVEKSKVDADMEFVHRLRGRTGISLQRYVLGVMLSAVTGEANRLLKLVHGGRYQLYRTDMISGSGHKGGLELEVLDAQNNEKRSVTTLSGGEKFLVALSLAIGLSTVVQAQGNGVRLGAMFIDEGFGSLDQNSIYDALEVLQGIQKANGLVGIISHVELLQDVISCKIVVKKGKNGSELTM